MAGFICVWFFLTRAPCRIVTTSAKDDHLRVLWGEINRFISSCVLPLDVKAGGPLQLLHQEVRKMELKKRHPVAKRTELPFGGSYVTPGGAAEPLDPSDPGSYTKQRCPLSYLRGMVASQDSIASMQGHHIAKTGDGIPRTLFVVDEASSVHDDFYKMGRTWANRILVIGNTWPNSGFWYKAIKGDSATNDPGGDIAREVANGRTEAVAGGDKHGECSSQRGGVGNLRDDDGGGTDSPSELASSGVDNNSGVEGSGGSQKPEKGYHRRVIRVQATDSPNVMLALREISLGREPSLTMLVPGVKDYPEYAKNLRMLNAIERTVILEAAFYEGAEVRLYPAAWLTRAERYAEKVKASGKRRTARAIGIDPAEGGDKTAMAAVDEWGLIELVSKQTQNTAVITGEVIAFARKHGLGDRPECWVFDAGGGGKEHADRLREQGHTGVRCVGFGEAVSPPLRRYLATIGQRTEEREDRYAYTNRRAEMYGELRQLLDPDGGIRVELAGAGGSVAGGLGSAGGATGPRGGFLIGGATGFGLPREYSELRRQLSPIPLTYDGEGRLFVIPKNRKAGVAETKQKTLTEILGCSPDEADAVVLSCWCMLHPGGSSFAGAMPR